MISIKISDSQYITNLSNSKKNFTYNLTENNANYIVSCKNIYVGDNPSIANLIYDVRLIINSNKFDSIGGWMDKDTDLYYLDANIHFSDINIALKFAAANNQLAIFDKKNKQVIYLNN